MSRCGRCRCSAVLLLLQVLALARGDDAAAVLGRATLFGRASDLTARVVMDIQARGGTKQRELDVALRRRAGTPVEILMRVVAPAFLTEMSYLSSRDADGRESRWLKTSRGVRKLSLADRGERLFDSDFTVADVTEFRAEDYELTSLEAETIASVLCDVVEAVRKRDSPQRLRIWVDTQGGLLWRVDTYDSGGRLVKRYLLQEAQRIGGEPYPLTCTMESTDSSTRTVLRFRDIRTGAALPDRLFSRGNL